MAMQWCIRHVDRRTIAASGHGRRGVTKASREANARVEGIRARSRGLTAHHAETASVLAVAIKAIARGAQIAIGKAGRVRQAAPPERRRTEPSRGAIKAASHGTIARHGATTSRVGRRAKAASAAVAVIKAIVRGVIARLGATTTAGARGVNREADTRIANARVGEATRAIGHGVIAHHVETTSAVVRHAVIGPVAVVTRAAVRGAGVVTVIELALRVREDGVHKVHQVAIGLTAIGRRVVMTIAGAIRTASGPVARPEGAQAAASRGAVIKIVSGRPVAARPDRAGVPASRGGTKATARGVVVEGIAVVAVKVARHGKAGGAHKVRRVIVRPAIIRLAVTMTVAAPEAGLAMKVANRGAPAAAAARLIASARRGRRSLAAANRGAQALAIARLLVDANRGDQNAGTRRVSRESRATMNSAPGNRHRR